MLGWLRHPRLLQSTGVRQMVRSIAKGAASEASTHKRCRAQLRYPYRDKDGSGHPALHLRGASRKHSPQPSWS